MKLSYNINTVNKKRSFTLIELMVAIIVFALVMIGAGGIFLSVQQSWQSQKTIVDLVRESRWTIEFISNEVREGTTSSSPGWARLRTQANGRRMRFGIDTDSDSNPDTIVWYWRGNGGILGDRDKLYRGTGTTLLGPGGANGNREELVNFIIDNPTTNDIFTESSGVLTIEITMSINNKNYTLRSQARPRN